MKKWVVLITCLLVVFTVASANAQIDWSKLFDKPADVHLSPGAESDIFAVGDVTQDKLIGQDDIDFLMAYTFKGGSAPSPYYTGDANCDGFVDIDDVVFLIDYIYDDGDSPVCNIYADKSQSFGYSEFDLAITSIIFSDNTPQVGQIISVTTNVLNNGSICGNITSIGGLDCPPEGSNISCDGFGGGIQIPLCPGESYEFTEDKSFSIPGTWEITRVVSGKGINGENDTYLYNNEMMKYLEVEGNITTAWCQENDDGNKLFIKGTTWGEYSDGTEFSFTDYCVDVYNINEYWCLDYTAPTSHTYDCRAYDNRVCVEGACVPAQPNGTDFDLALISMTLSDTTPEVGQTVTVTKTVRNYGNVAGYITGSSAADVTPSGGGGASYEIMMVPISAGETKTYTDSVTFDVAGTWQLKRGYTGLGINNKTDANLINNNMTLNVMVHESNITEPYCGDGTCNGNETFDTCPEDCEAPDEPGDSVVAQYSFNECSGVVVNDASGNGHDGIAASANWVAGYGGCALEFDKVQSRFVKVEDSDDFDLDTFSIEAMVYMTSDINTWPKGYQTIVSKEYQYILRFFGEYTTGDHGLSAIYFYGGPGVYKHANLRVSEFNWEPNRWYKIKFTYDGSYIRIIIDGVLRKEVYSPSSSYPPTHSNAYLFIGNHIWGGTGTPSSSDEFIGKIDNVVISGEVSNITQTCTDSDGGLNYYTFGECMQSGNGGSGGVVDYCASSLVLKECYCSGDTLQSYDYSCPEGCSAGVCLTNITEPYCGDGICNGNETNITCPEDCSGIGRTVTPGKTNQPLTQNAGSDWGVGTDAVDIGDAEKGIIQTFEAVKSDMPMEPKAYVSQTEVEVLTTMSMTEAYEKKITSRTGDIGYTISWFFCGQTAQERTDANFLYDQYLELKTHAETLQTLKSDLPVDKQSLMSDIITGITNKAESLKIKAEQKVRQAGGICGAAS